MSNVDRNDPCLCGSTKKFKHCCQRKEKAQVAKRHPNAAMVPMWLKLAMQHLQAERLQQAKMLYEQILQVNPRHADALQWLGVIFHKQGNSERAIELINQAITETPANALFHSTLGNVFQALGQSDAAIASYRHALSIQQNFAEAHNNLGIALMSKGKFDEAIESYRTAVSLVPHYAEAFNNLGLALHAQELPVEAMDAYKRAVSISPNYAKAFFNLANVLREKTPEQAIPFIQQALAVKPDFYEAWVTLGELQKNQGNLDHARFSFRRAASVKPGEDLKVIRALLLSPIMGTKEEVTVSRAMFNSNLDQMIAERVTLDNPMNKGGNSNFQLAYHGLNDKEIQEKIAHFYGQACPGLLYVAPHCSQRRDAGQKTRIGFLSKFISRHSVASSFSRIVQALATQEEFDVALISSHDPQAASVQETYPNFGGEHVHLGGELAQAREQIAALELDILVYLDIGMEPLSYFLAFSRLARAQCVLGGHPVTTGIGALDYFVSSDLAEPENADSHYSEKLVRLPFGCFYFKRPELPVAFKTRHELGLPELGNIYLCPMVLHKLHPDFDEAMARILELDTDGRVVLVADKKYGTWQKLLEARFQKTVPQNVRDRIVFLPWVANSLDFISVNKAADVVLDPFHFGIGSTAIATCSVGTPIVTRPGEFMRGRVGLFYAKIMDVMECVAADTEDYARKAVAIATDPTLREGIRSKILANNHALFENPKAIRDVTAFFSELAAKSDA